MMIRRAFEPMVGNALNPQLLEDSGEIGSIHGASNPEFNELLRRLFSLSI
jgi:hypothetical protein